MNFAASCFQKAALLIVTIMFTVDCRHTGRQESTENRFLPVATRGELKNMNTGAKWSRCFQFADGTIYFKDGLMSKDNGKTVVQQTGINLREINDAPERAVFSNKNLFYALDGPTAYVHPGLFKGRAWRSVDNLKSISQEEVLFGIPDGAAPIKNNTEWFGLFVYRSILSLPDGTWLMTMYGNFIADTLIPYDGDARKETRYLQRSLIVASDDEGRTWSYRSTIAAPKAGDPVGEGFVEPAITILQDGRLLCVMRSGHHYPLYSSWSCDTGKTWTYPEYTGLDRGCDPCLVTLHDGRVALSWGRRFPEGWSKISPEGDKGSFVYPGEGYTNLSISNDGGHTWYTQRIIHPSGSCYSTIFEVEPNVVFIQSDQWYCRVTLKQFQP